MQQVATKGSQIAALPIDLEVQSSQRVNNNDHFRQALEQSANRNAEKDKKGEVTPIWKAPEQKPRASKTDQIVSERPEVSKATIDSHKKVETKSITPPNAEQVNAKPKKNELEDENNDTNWLELVESVKEYNDNPDKAALANVADTVSGDDIILSDELAAKIEALLATLGEDSAISNDEMSILSVIQQQLNARDTEAENPVTLPSLLNNISQSLNEMVTKAVDAGNNTESPKLTSLAAAMLALQSSQPETADDPKAVLAPQDGVKSAADLEETAKLLISLMQSEKNNAANTSPKTNDLSYEKMTLSQNAEKLLQNMQKLSDKGQGETVEAIADRVLKLLPPNASEQQQQTVKNAVIAGLNEMNAQLAQGREPGISLQDMIAGALSEANIQFDNSVKQQLEGQFTLLNNAMQTAQQTMVQDTDRQTIASIDTSLRENSQIRSEMSKAQQAADGFDKPVNLQRAEGQQQLSEKIRWMINSRSSLAEIRLDPPELGSMQVRVNISGDTANVNFVVQSQHAKDTLTEAENRLRDMLAEQGITLGESFVQQQGSQQENAEGEHGGSGHRGESSEDEEQSSAVEMNVRKRDTNGIDDYA
ncbi:flagellar hook-length control protein FliK [Alteromonas sp. ASW11-130]|uniref:flagellar hook-length control protein FliK n=1 Tax=Alteromonas sp. ASW11-130 TaxID=3015775 RepID=UPI0022429AD2|nr:flagellar hook-length control protein FliK [Alteromonas sp. ASW11-130]MCW8090363.1 flagellar hook-length control protein FliK [Alteromonas sp. ASW11-130]